MAGFSAFAPPCMVAGLNGLDLKKIQMRVKFKICFKFGLKIKKYSQRKIFTRSGAQVRQRSDEC
jgi:hypothetical protein